MIESSPLKHLASVRIVNGVGEAAEFDNPEWPRYVRTTDIASPRSLRTDTFKSLPPQIASRAPLEDGDIVMTAAGATIGKSLLYSSPKPACYAGYLVRFRPKHGVDSRFIAYWMESQHYWDQISTGKVVSTIENFSAGKYQNLRCPSPPSSAQRAIADYLDTETTRIDALIEKKRRVVELLEARRRIVVSEGVSGNSPRVGQRLRHVSHLVRGSGFPHEKQGSEEGDLPFFKVGDLSRPANNPFLLECENWVSHETALELRATIVPPNSVMFPKIGAALAGGVRRISTIPSVCDNNVLAVVPSTIEARYLRYWLSTVDLVEIANPGPVPSLDDDALKDLRVPITDRRRQSAIADHLDFVTQKLNSLTTQIRTQLHLLRERRRVLITAAVSGELEVSGVTA